MVFVFIAFVAFALAIWKFYQGAMLIHRADVHRKDYSETDQVILDTGYDGQMFRSPAEVRREGWSMALIGLGFTVTGGVCLFVRSVCRDQVRRSDAPGDSLA